MLTTDLIRAQEKDSRRLMVVLHGLGDSMEGYRWLPEILNLPWLNYLLVNAPDEYYGGYSWFNFAGDYAPGVVRSRKLLFDLLDAQRAQGYASEQISLFGFSQGCLMTLDAGLRYPHRLAGLVGISGAVFEPETLLKEISPQGRTTPVLVTHGAQDTVIPISRTRPQIQLLTQAGLNLTWREFMKAHTIAGEAEVRVIRDFVSAAYGASTT